MIRQLGGIGLALLAVGCSEVSGALIGDPYSVRLADHLSAADAKMYGAYWCPHCDRQKQLFGRGASRIPYIECDPTGIDAQPELCQTQGVQGYPTWEINGELYLGVQPLGRLAELTGFEAPPAPDPVTDSPQFSQ